MADLFDELGIGKESKGDLFDELGVSPKGGDLFDELKIEAEKPEAPEGEGRFRVLGSTGTVLREGAGETVANIRHQFQDRYRDHYNQAAEVIRRMQVNPNFRPSEKELVESKNPLLDQYVQRLDAAGKDREAVAGQILQELEAGSRKFAARAEGSLQEAEEHGRKIQEATPEDPSFLEEAYITGLRSALPTGAGLAVGALAGPSAGAAAAGILGGAAAAAGTYREAGEKDPTLTPEEKAKIGLVDGLLESVGEGLSLRVALRAGVPLFRRLLQAIGAESSSEALTSLMQDANAKATYDPELSFRDFAYNAALGATAGGMMGGAAGSIAHAGQSIGERLGRQKDNDRQIVQDLLAEDAGSATPEGQTPQPQAPAGQLTTEELLKLEPEAQDDGSDPELIEQLTKSVGREAAPIDPRELSIQIAREHVQRLGGDLEAIGAEASILERRLQEAAKDKDYTPSPAESADLQLAQEVLQEVRGMKTREEVIGHMMNRILRAEHKSELEQPLFDIFVNDEPDFYANEMYDGLDFAQNTSGTATAPAEYFLLAAQRQASGYYPFSHGVLIEEDFDLKATVDQFGWRRLPSKKVSFQTADPRGLQFAQLLEKWMEAFAPNAKIYLVDQPNYEAIRGKPLRARPHGTYRPIQSDEGLIYLDMNSGDDAQQTLVLAHEFGHFLTGEYLRRQPKFVKDAVEKTWARQVRMLQKRNQKLGASSAETRSPLLVDYGQQESMQAAIGNRPLIRGYLFSFEEWLAHQMERVAMGDRLADMGKHVAAFFKKAGARLKRWFEKNQQTIAPTQTYEDFIRLGALRERERALIRQNLAGVEAALQEYGVKEIPADLKDIHKSLVKALKNMKAQPGLVDGLLQATPEVQQRAVKAMDRIGQREAAMMTPQVGGPPVEMTPEEWVAGIEDAWLPGQEKAAFGDLLAGREPRGSLASSRIASALRTAIRNPKDSSPYRGDLDKFMWYRKYWHTLEQVAKANPHIEQLQRYVRGIRAWSADRMAWVARADGRLRQWRNLSSNDQKILGRYLLDQSADETFYDLNDPRVRAKYPLSPEGQQLYQQINSDFQDFLTATEATMISQVAARLIKNPMAAKAEIQRIQQRFAEIRSKPYFPLARFGRHIVTVRATADMVVRGKNYKEGEVVHLEAFDTRFAQLAEYERIRRAYPNADIQMSEVGEETASLAGMPTLLIEALKHNPDIGLSEEQKKAIDEYLAKIAPGQSFVKNLVKRKTVEGYTEDVMRAYSNYFFHGASHLARIRHVQKLNDEIRATRITADLMTGDSTKRMQIHNYMFRHFKYLMQPENDWSALRGAISVSYLGFMIKSALVNLTQVPMVTFPHLAAKWGDARASAAILKGYRDAVAMYSVTKPLTKAEEEAVTRWVQGQPPLPGDDPIIQKWSKFSTEEVAMLRKAMQESWIDESLAMELAAMSEGSWLTRYKTTSKAGYYARTLSHYSMIPFQAAEKLNRRVTALAAFRLAKSSGATFEQAYEAAREAVSSSQFEYAKWNRPEMLRGKKGLVFMFWQYQLNMLYFAFGGDKGFWRWWLIALVAGGVSGLPFAEDLMNLATWVYSKLGNENRFTNVKHEVKKFLRELEETIGLKPDLLMHGASRYGFGLLPWADVSGSISMGRIVPGAEMLARPSSDWESFVARGIEEGAGATGSLVMRMIQATTATDMDTLTRLEKGMPVSVLQKALQAYKAYDRGAMETRGGADIVEFDATDPWHMAEIFGMAVGFPSRRANDTRENFYMAQDYVRYYQIRRQILLKALDDSYERGSTNDRREAIEAIKRFNKDVPSRSLSITRDQILQSRRRRETGRARIESGGHSQRLYDPLTRSLREGGR